MRDLGRQLSSLSFASCSLSFGSCAQEQALRAAWALTLLQHLAQMAAASAPAATQLPRPALQTAVAAWLARRSPHCTLQVSALWVWVLYFMV